ncbi:MAG: hypothetical protein K2W99_06365 [Chthoniobacterales bacterium]|nr:hypothetical protein [Chthoniobacterales bacterium]
MKKIILSSLVVLLLSLTSLLALESVTETYTKGYVQGPFGWNYFYLFSSQVQITWSAEPLAESASDGSAQYLVAITIKNNNTEYDGFYDWNLGFLRADEFVSSNDSLLQATSSKTLNNFGGASLVTPAGTSKLMLSKESSQDHRYGVLKLDNETITYTAKLASGSMAIVPPDYVLVTGGFSKVSFTLDGHPSTESRNLTIALQRDSVNQAPITPAAQ